MSEYRLNKYIFYENELPFKKHSITQKILYYIDIYKRANSFHIISTNHSTVYLNYLLNVFEKSLCVYIKPNLRVTTIVLPTS